MIQIQETADWLREKGIEDPEIGIVLGTGLGDLATKIDIEKEISYNAIPNFPIASVEFHLGKLIYGTLGGKKVLAMQGRYHYYEGYSMKQIVLPVRVMKLLGVEKILFSNAAGAVNLNFEKGSLMLLDDHINLLPENPLRGRNLDQLGSRFPDMSQPYDKGINTIIKDIAKTKGLVVNEGVYAAVEGPNLETRAEYRYLKTIGADAVGMSTVPEVIACVHAGIPCACVSVLTDVCDPDNLRPIDIEDIIATAKEAEQSLTELYVELLKRL